MISSQGFLYGFLALFLIGLALHVILNLLNQKFIYRRASLPEFFQGKMTEETFSKSRLYALEHLRFDLFSLFYGNAMSLIILFSGLLPALNGAFTHLSILSISPLTQGVITLLTLIVLQSITQIPVEIYSTFHLEGRYGFNTMTWKLYIVDMLKRALLTLVIAVPILYAILAFIESTGKYWWLWIFLFVSGLQLFLMVAYPLWIAPLFNRFKPLADGPLKQALLDMAEKANFPTQDIYVMDGSRRSNHSNAYFTGFGKWRRIVLYDTLVNQMTIPELVSVLAHEIGHYKKKHIYKSLAFYFVGMGLLLYLFSLLLHWLPLYQAFGLEKASHAMGLFLFFTSISVFSILISPWRNRISRQHEYEADAYSAGLCKDRESMQNALLKLAEKNLSNLTPHPWYSAFYYSHPTILERMTALARIALKA